MALFITDKKEKNIVKDVKQTDEIYIKISFSLYSKAI